MGHVSRHVRIALLITVPLYNRYSIKTNFSEASLKFDIKSLQWVILRWQKVLYIGPLFPLTPI